MAPWGSKRRDMTWRWKEVQAGRASSELAKEAAVD